MVALCGQGLPTTCIHVVRFTDHLLARLPGLPITCLPVARLTQQMPACLSCVPSTCLPAARFSIDMPAVCRVDQAHRRPFAMCTQHMVACASGLPSACTHAPCGLPRGGQPVWPVYQAPAVLSGGPPWLMRIVHLIRGIDWPVNTRFLL